MAERLEKKPPGGLPGDAHSEETHKTPDPRLHYVELDALRGIGLLGIVMTHTVQFWDDAVRKPLSVPLLNIDLLDFFRSGGLAPFGILLFFLLRRLTQISSCFIKVYCS